MQMISTSFYEPDEIITSLNVTAHGASTIQMSLHVGHGTLALNDSTGLFNFFRRDQASIRQA
jgi:hypothetical protein